MFSYCKTQKKILQAGPEFGRVKMTKEIAIYTIKEKENQYVPQTHHLHTQVLQFTVQSSKILKIID